MDNVWTEQSWPDELYGNLRLSKTKLSVRLLRLLPGHLGDPLRCKLLRTVLVSSAPYEALSYTWGSTAERVPIKVNNIETLVTRNLERALQNLRHEERPRLLWIDALCINQHDPAERSRQVQEMGNIYSFAERVLVWLDCPFRYQDPIIDVVRARRTSNRSVKSVDAKSSIDCCTFRCEYGPSSVAIRALTSLLALPWFTRVWVVQEASRARKDPVILIGYQKELKLSDLAAAVRASIQGSELKHSNLWTLVKIRDRTRTPPRLREDVTEDPTPERARRHLGEDLLYLLESTRHFQSTDPRDKIFALWTLVRGTSDHRFKPDYAMSMQQVYTAVTSEIVEGLGTLDVLTRRWGRPTVNLPTWVPDYSLPPPPFSALLSRLDPALTNLLERKATEVSIDSTDLSHRKLMTSGVCLDVITKVLSISPFVKLMHLQAELGELRAAFGRSPQQGRLVQVRQDGQWQEHAIVSRQQKTRMTEDLQLQQPYLHTIVSFAHGLVSDSMVAGLALHSAEEQDYIKASELLNEANRFRGGQSTNASKSFAPANIYIGPGRCIEEIAAYAWVIIEAHVRSELGNYVSNRSLDGSENLQEKLDNIVATASSSGCFVRQDHAKRTTKFDVKSNIVDILWEGGDNAKTWRETLIQKLALHLEWSLEMRTAMGVALDVAHFTESDRTHIRRIISDICDRSRLVLQDYQNYEPPNIQLYQTKSGLTGFGSEDLQVGDQIAVLKGLPSVCVLRSTDEGDAVCKQKTFRGCAYLHGAQNTNFDSPIETIEIV
jgi:hypothetical protein